MPFEGAAPRKAIREFWEISPRQKNQSPQRCEGFQPSPIGTLISKGDSLKETIKCHKEKKELIVEENRRNQLDAKLKEMIKQFERSEVKRNEPIKQSATGNGLRRREGEKAKRFSVWNKRRVTWRTSFFFDSDYTDFTLVCQGQGPSMMFWMFVSANVDRWWEDQWGLRLQAYCVFNNHPLAITNSAYCVDKKDAGYDFETELEPQVAVEIFISRSTAWMEWSVSYTWILSELLKRTISKSSHYAVRNEKAGPWWPCHSVSAIRGIHLVRCWWLAGWIPL